MVPGKAFTSRRQTLERFLATAVSRAQPAQNPRRRQLHGARARGSALAEPPPQSPRQFQLTQARVAKGGLAASSSPPAFSSCSAMRSGMCKNKAQTAAAMKHSSARPYRPPAKLPVASFMNPTHQGPKKPPRLPMELIQAMVPAAAVPVRNIGGIAQNGPFEP